MIDRRLLALAFAVVASSFSACGSGSGEDEFSPAKVAAAAKAAGTVNGRCPVMGNLVVADTDTYEYKGEKFGFCCPPCRPKFIKNPEKYLEVMRKDPAKYGYHK